MEGIGATQRSILVMGVSGSGKSTVGEAIAKILNLEFIDGDDLHTEESIRKMSSGFALTDEDRLEWLLRINSRLRDARKDSSGIVIAASLLKPQYRKLAVEKVSPRPLTVLLSIPLEESVKRLSTRKNHFMPPELAASQFEILDDSSEVDLIVDGTTEVRSVLDQIVLKLKAN